MLKRVYTNLGPPPNHDLDSGKPVVVPKLLPTTKITRPTSIGFNPVVKLPKFSKMKIKLKVAIISNIKLNSCAAIAGCVAKIPTSL